MVTTNDDRLAERVRLIRNHAEAVVEDKGEHDLVNMVGFNFRLTEMQAAIGRAQLRKLGMLLADRQKNCAYLAEKLSRIPGIVSPPVREGASHAYYVQPFLYDETVSGVRRDRFIEAVKAELPATALRELEGQQIGVGYTKPLYLLPLFQKRIAFGSEGFPFTLATGDRAVSYDKGMCPVAERLHEQTLFTHEFMRPPATREDLDDVVRAFEKVYEHREEL
jgi:dTDP-4-amino-4,6-dideoxygalactose transaminase